ncbi:DUF2127 domain-containing protein [Pseudoxanthomonas sacheonensis]|uniref:Uncharacterized membrane protein (DUF2068 family) n=1 Tax=Pseudoxanthomonas sacheonensis TaxID=443615 RepID=A0ABU1RUZ2_9GAMM|nr:DUF2127 domain-containing protein [Pseudoxanthomonas sacheonensis]MDR6842590.1 uncharacterized membrane protein (DUF2068 family) [Pseudoxanthomonas sacheonensis]
MTETPYNPAPQAHPGLHVLALFEGLKGLLALIAAASLEVLGPQPLRHLIAVLIAKFNLNPVHGTLPSLLDAINPGAVHLAVAVVSLYAVWRLIEAWGLWRAKAWASWLGCVGTAAYLPLDVYALYRHHGWHTWTVLVLNLIVVAVLARDLVKRHASAS